MSCATLIKPKKHNSIDWSVLERIKKIQRKRRQKTESEARPALFRKRTPMR